MIIDDSLEPDDSQKVLVIHVPLEQYRWLTKHAKRHEMRISSIVQRAIDIMRQENIVEIDISSEKM